MSTGYTSLGSEAAVTGSVPVAAGPSHALQFQESNLQTFPPSDPRGKLTGSFQPPQDADDTFSKPANGGPGNNAAAPSSGFMAFFSVHAYRPYFNVDTSDVVQRIVDSVFPLRGDFVEKTSHNPDMYGPFWICSTLVFLTAALGNLAEYLAHKTSAGGTVWHYDITKVSGSAGLFYGYVGIVPLALYFVLKYLGVTSGLVQLWCLYGYSLFVFIPASFFSAVPVEAVRWVAVGVAGVMSAVFLGVNIRSHIKTASERWLLIVIGSAVVQLGLALVVKRYFFTFFYEDKLPG